jgi:PilZ domain-containing protein
VETSEEKAKRRHERFKVEIRARVTVQRNGKPAQFSGMAHDIGVGGLALFLPAELKVGESCEIEIALPYSRPLIVRAVIRNRDRFEHGVEFFTTTGEEREALIRNCRALALLG